MVTVNLNGDFVDATTLSGEELTKRYNIMSVPTIIFFNEKNEEVLRAATIDEVKNIAKNRTLV